jgi:translation initiation factor IF-2
VAKIRVYELARSLGMTAGDLRKTLNELGVEVKSASSSLDEETAQMVRELFTKETPAAEKVAVPPRITVRDLADRFGADPSSVVQALVQLGIMATANEEVDFATAEQIAPRFNAVVVPLAEEEAPAEAVPEVEERVAPKAEARPPAEPAAPAVEMPPRPPVVTIMGHVDHGKTTLLDAIRHTHVTEQEFGGITQHIGAYQVTMNGRRITFIDTPGHHAFTEMRARGAKVTDVVVVVVAADDGVMDQTIEAIDHARAAGVPIVVAINKIDLPTANDERVKHQLVEQNLVPEEFGGDVICVPISAKNGEGIDRLLEMILLVADLQELTAERDKPARGAVIEARRDKQRGTVATVLIEEGTLRRGDAVVAGLASGKVRAMMDDRGEAVAFAGPSAPVEIMGLSSVPAAGDVFEVVADERTAKQISEQRQLEQREREMRTSGARVTLQDFYKQMQEGEAKELNIVLKCDAHGSIEALRKSLEQLEHAEVRVNVIHAGVGDVSQSDVMLASASNAIIIGFNIRIEPQARRSAEDEKIDVRIYRVIYDVINDVQAAMLGMLEPVFEEVVLGRAQVRAVFDISRIGKIAGCMVTNGRIVRNAQVRVLRDGQTVHTGAVSSLRHLKDDVSEIAQGFECGIGVAGFQDWQEGDVIEAFQEQEVRRATL